MSMLRLICIVLPVLVIVGSLRAQDTSRIPPKPEKDIVILDHADSLVGLELEGERARQLIGNVHFTHGKTVVTCDRAIQYLQTNKVALEGEVIVRDDSMTLYTSRGMYYSDTKAAEGFDVVRLEDGKSTLRARYGKYFTAEHRAFFRTNVIVDDTSSRLHSNELTYYRDLEKTVADGDVRIDNFENRVTLFGEHFENDRKRKYSIMTNNPRAIQIDTSSDGTTYDTLFVRSDQMESYQDSVPRLVNLGNVAMKRKEFSAEAGQAVFFTKTDSIELRKAPFVWVAQSPKESTQVSGDSIFVRLVKRKPDRMYVRGNAFAASQADSIHRGRYNQMSGQEIVIRFEGNAVQRIDVDRTATMLYYVFDGPTPNGLNKSTGDHGTITFTDKKLNAVTMRGGVEGQYFPENMVRGKENDYNLAGLNWRSPRKQNFLSFR